jgi:hypothetical protein
VQQPAVGDSAGESRTAAFSRVEKTFPPIPRKMLRKKMLTNYKGVFPQVPIKGWKPRVATLVSG